MSKKLTTAEFATRATVVHNNKYCYAKVNYTGNKIKVTITCPAHGDFNQAPNHHLSGIGCPKCGTQSQGDLQRSSTATFITKSHIIHGNNYDYTKAYYTGVYTKVVITCPIHGDFEQIPHNHLNGKGCKKCAVQINSDLQRNSTESFIIRAKALHLGVYSYEKVDYVQAHTNIIITCQVHGDFLQTPTNHLSGQGCPLCCGSGFDKTKAGILYYVKVVEGTQVLYKIGITNRTVLKRFSKDDLTKITILKTWEYPIGIDAFDKEQQILKMYKEFSYVGLPVLDSGNTELFIYDVLSLDPI